MEKTEENSERDRIKALESFQILDSTPEATFDQLTMLAARVCQTPIALLSFIDEERQWIKSSFGISLTELPRHITVCNQAIKHEGLHIIPDASRQTCSYMDYMKSLGFMFYAGVPIITKDRHAIGSLCVVDKNPKELSQEQLETLKSLATQILENLEFRKKYREDLKRLNDLSVEKHTIDQRHADFTQRRVRQSVAEMSSGLDYRMRPHLLNIRSRCQSFLEKTETSGEAALLSILESVDSLLSILEKLGNFVTAEKERRMKLLEINSLLEEVVEYFKKELEEKAITLKLSLGEELRCVGNYAKLMETFYALIKNAIEAIGEREGGILEIRMTMKDQLAYIDIVDNGVGVDDSIRAFIFQPFFSTKALPGTGIGLALAQAHLEDHSGEMKLVHAKDPTIFRVTLPVPAVTI